MGWKRPLFPTKESGLETKEEDWRGREIGQSLGIPSRLFPTIPV